MNRSARSHAEPMNVKSPKSPAPGKPPSPSRVIRGAKSKAWDGEGAAPVSASDLALAAKDDEIADLKRQVVSEARRWGGPMGVQSQAPRSD